MTIEIKTAELKLELSKIDTENDSICAIVSVCNDLCDALNDYCCIHDYMFCAELLSKILFSAASDFYCLDIVPIIGTMIFNLNDLSKFVSIFESLISALTVIATENN